MLDAHGITCTTIRKKSRFQTFGKGIFWSTRAKFRATGVSRCIETTECFICSAEGAWWQYEDLYGFYFKKATDSSHDFYFTMDSTENPAGQLPLKIVESR